MMNLQLHIKIAGALLVMLALAHIGFAKYFKWREDCSSMSLINRQMMYVHTFFIALVVMLMGTLCLNAAEDLVTTALGKKVCLGFAVFWSARLIIQFFGYSPKLWRGKRLETAIHILFSVCWVYFCLIFWQAVFRY